MKAIFWTEEAFAALEQITATDATALEKRLELVTDFPNMYPRRQRGPFAGLRYFVVRRRWILFYRVRDDGSILVIDLVPALKQQ